MKKGEEGEEVVRPAGKARAGQGGAAQAPWTGDYAKLSLSLRVCPNCGEHGEVMVTQQGGVVIQSMDVRTRQEALSYHAELIQRGGVEQSEFLAQVAGADYLQEDYPQEEDGFGSVDFMFGGVVVVIMSRGTMVASGGRPNSPSQVKEIMGSRDLSGAELTLTQCSCRQHGVMSVKLSTGETVDVAAPLTKEAACRELEGLYLQFRDFPDQPAFVNAVRDAEWLPGPMPVEL